VTTEPGHTGRAHAAMTHRERVEAALRGLPVDRPAISLWRHFPGQDDTGQRLADATIQFQNQYDVDLIKLMPTGMYCVVDYGVEIALADDDVGSTHFVSGPIREPADWGRLPDVSPTRGFLREQVEAVKILRCRLGADTPIIQTIFSPLTMAAKLVGTADALERTIRENEGQLGGALDRMASDVIAFGRACLDAGADGFFFATQLATRSALPTGVYERLGIPYDRKVLDALRSGSWCTVLHLHGLDPMFDLADVYPVDAVNWHDRETTPSLTEALQRTRRALVAGIARRGVIAHG
jgi:uroporphyrinogen decarboxylase